VAVNIVWLLSKLRVDSRAIQWYRESIRQQEFDNKLRFHVGLDLYKERAYVRTQNEILDSKAKMDEITYSRQEFEILKKLIKEYKEKIKND
jgi:hypothetical protein